MGNQSYWAPEFSSMLTLMIERLVACCRFLNFPGKDRTICAYFDITEIFRFDALGLLISTLGIMRFDNLYL